ncbi:MAG: FtsX-like permease family protein [Acidimicrobiales bacterium]
MAWRDTWTAKGRSALVIALIGLPVLVLAAVDVGYHTYNRSPVQAFARANGTAATVELSYSGQPMAQLPSGTNSSPTGPPASGPTSAPGPAGAPEVPTVSQVGRLLGPGSKVIERANANLTVVSKAGLASISLLEVDLTNPLARGLASITAGRAPRAAGEVVVTPTLASQAGLRIGSTMTATQPAERYRVVGIAADPSKHGVDIAWGLPPAPAGPPARPAPAPGPVAQPDYLASTTHPVTWSEVRRLNASGYVVQSRWVDAHPPPASRSHFVGGSSPRVNKSVVATYAIIGGLGLLEVVLLAGPALAIMARRRQRTLGLVAAAGGDRRDLRNTVLANGVVLGVVAGVLAVALGIGVARVAEPILAIFTHTRPGPLGTRPADLALIGVVALVTALVAALQPARAAARTDVVAALAGRRPRVPSRLRVPILAAVVAGLGVLIALVGATRSGGTVAILLGVALVEVGLVVATPSILLLVTSLGHHLPLAPRLALRDAGRNRSSAAPAAAAVMAAVIGCVGALLAVSSLSAADASTYQPSLPSGDVSVSMNPPLSATARPGWRSAEAAVTAALRSKLDTSSVAVVSNPGLCNSTGGCNVTVAPHVAPGTRVTTRVSGTSFGFGAGTALVASAGALPALTGLSPAALAPAETAMRAGKAVMVDAWAVRHGIAALDVTATPISVPSAPRPAALRTVHVPAVVLGRGFAPALAILPPSLARRIGVGSTPEMVLASTIAMPTTTDLQGLRAALVKVEIAHPALFNPYQLLSVGSPFRPRGKLAMLILILATALVALAAAGIATGLANVDRAEDLRTLDAVGASPRTRRVLSAARAGVVAGLGTLIGAAAGFVPALAWIAGTNRTSPPPSSVAAGAGGISGSIASPQLSSVMHLVVPWGELAAVVVGIPLTAALLAAAFSRSPLTQG